MQAKELRAKAREELATELEKLRKERFALRMQQATGQAVKPDQFGKVRRDIARVKTVMRELNTGAVAPQASAGGRAK
jgi:large subunit ribosomal protein L29